MKLENLDNVKATKFERKVWREILKIQHGKTTTYKNIADKLGVKNGSRAVANACGKNPYLITIPCHRVIRSDGFLGGYSGQGGLKRKKQLLLNEGHRFSSDDKII